MSSLLKNHWIDNLLKKELVYIKPIKLQKLFSLPLMRLPLEIQQEVENYNEANEQELLRLIWDDVRAHPSYVGYVFTGFTSYCNQNWVSFKRPKYQEMAGHKINWKIVSVHRKGDTVFLLRFGGCVTVDLDYTEDFYGLLKLYRDVKKKKKEKIKKLILENDVNEIRKLLVNMLYF
jgi:hypothetical protein